MRTIALALAAVASVGAAQPHRGTHEPFDAARAYMPFGDVRPILDALRPELLPADLQPDELLEIEARWPEWAARHDARTRARVEEGDRDSIAHFALYGTSFTPRPRVTEWDVASASHRLAATPLVQDRIHDLVRGVTSPGSNERLQFARGVLEQSGIDPAAPEWPERVRRWLDQAVTRIAADYARRSRERQQTDALSDPATRSLARATVFHDRGLASDTSLPVSFAIEQALGDVRAAGLVSSGQVRRVAIIGPGLDFADKREGHDFYPVQTVQPFAVIDSLLRSGLAASDLQVATFDLSPRVNHHLHDARHLADRGEPYVLTLPRDREPFAWTSELAGYWRRAGDQIGTGAEAVPPPDALDTVDVRAVRVRSSIVHAIHPHDLNVVVERPAGTGQFDLVIATNILLYYDVFEQSLALTNIAAMLRSGGLLLSNTAVIKLPSIPLELLGFTETLYTDRPDGDRIFWCRRQ